MKRSTDLLTTLKQRSAQNTLICSVGLQKILVVAGMMISLLARTAVTGFPSITVSNPSVTALSYATAHHPSMSTSG